ncbi:MAG: NUDIX hydrolase YfcD [Desulfurivibrio sp.]|nr:NUDIX hydrolase YfcD [Desulfurivibrio sp.]MBU3937185.1 NUDIX hydrolase YfcD [Pseudomonadota bacterium]MBU4119057.1 NUDIX hydrolase YfcD [Pseudomonadota bacterium]
MNPGDEIVLIVDEHNHEVAHVPRRVMREGGLIHRACYILVFNRKREIFVQKRTMTKDVYPGYLDVATGGVVLAGESYELSAKRELAEELGVHKVPLSSHFDFYHEADNNRVWGRVFSCVTDGPFVLQPEEVEDGFFLGVDAVHSLAESEKFTPDGLLVLKKFLAEHAGFS